MKKYSLLFLTLLIFNCEDEGYRLAADPIVGVWSLTSASYYGVPLILDSCHLDSYLNVVAGGTGEANYFLTEIQNGIDSCSSSQILEFSYLPVSGNENNYSFDYDGFDLEVSLSGDTLIISEQFNDYADAATFTRN